MKTVKKGKSTPAAASKKAFAARKKTTPTQPQAAIKDGEDTHMDVLAVPRPLVERAGGYISDEDMATLRELEATAEAVAKAREQAKIKPPVGWDGQYCATCDGDIEPKRLKLGYYTCIECETEKEKRAKVFNIRS